MSDPSHSVELATQLKIAWLNNPGTRASAVDVPVFLQTVHEAVARLANSGRQEPEQGADEHTPAVSGRKSLASREHIISMIGAASPTRRCAVI